jgi:glycosyltransferase involved in cell wall biosynthesis
MTAAPLSYAVVTPARNESDNLPRLARCLAAQTVPPAAWVIVDNGSTDHTAAVARALERKHAWIRTLDVPGERSPQRGRPIVRAFHAAIATFGDLPDVVVNLDADISVEPEYFARLLAEFGDDPRLGIAGGTCHERNRGVWRPRHVTGTTVWGASRAYRRGCLEHVLPLEERLGWDGIDEFKANAAGWRTATFDIPFRHHRREGERDGGRRRARAAQGRTAHYVGYRPWYLTLRALFNAGRDPAALAMLWGYAGAAAAGEPRCADQAVRAYVRSQQSLRRLPLRAREAFGRGTTLTS